MSVMFHPGKNETAGGCCGPPLILYLARSFDFSYPHVHM